MEDRRARRRDARRRWPHASGRRSRRRCRRLGDGRAAGTLDRSHVAGYGDAAPTHPWTILVGHDGVFKITLLTLFGLPLERFWMWSMDLCGITVVEFRAGRAVLRAHNLTDHLGAARDAAGMPEPTPAHSERGALGSRASAA